MQQRKPWEYDYDEEGRELEGLGGPTAPNVGPSPQIVGSIPGRPKTPTPLNPLDAQLKLEQLKQAPFDARRAAAEAQKAEIEAQRAAQQSDLGGVDPADPKNRARIANLEALAKQIDRVEELYRQNIAPTSGLAGIQDYFPTEDNKQFNAAAAGMAEQGLAAFRVPGVGAQSDAELRQFVEANRPSASDYDTTIEEKIRQLRLRLDESRKQYGLEPTPTGAVADGGSFVQFADEAPPLSARSFRLSPEQEQQIAAAAQSGASEQELIALFQKFGAGVDPESVRANVEFYSDPARRGVPSSFDYRKVDEVAPVDVRDGAVGAAARGFGDTVTLGFMDELGAAADTAFKGGSYAENLDRNRGIAAHDEKANWMARLGGQIGGGFALPTFGARSAAQLGKLGSGYGAAYGAGSADGDMADRAAGAGTGGLFGGAVGYGAGKLSAGIGSKLAARAQRKAPQVELADAAKRQDVPITVADYAPGTRKLYGNLHAMPITGGAVDKALRKGNERIEQRVAEIGGDNVTDRVQVGERVRDAGERWMERSGDQVRRAYSIAERRAAGQQITPAEAVKALDANIAELSRAPGTNSETIALLQKIRGDLIDDATGAAKAMDVGTLRGVRTKMGEYINANNLSHSDTERRVMQALDAADQDIGAQLTGGAKSAFDRAGKMHSSRKSTVQNVVRTFLGGRNDKALAPEQIVGKLEAAANPKGGNEAALRKMLSMTNEAERNEIASTLADTLGRAGTDGDNAFSSSRFFSEIQKYSPSARKAIWGEDGARDLADLARIAEQRKGVIDKQNHSGSGRVTAFYSAMVSILGGGGGTAAAAGVPGGKAGLSAAAGIVGTTYVTAKVLGSKAAVSALAYAARASTVQKQSTALRRIAALAAREPGLAEDLLPIKDELERAWADDYRRKRR